MRFATQHIDNEVRGSVAFRSRSFLVFQRVYSWRRHPVGPSSYKRKNYKKVLMKNAKNNAKYMFTSNCPYASFYLERQTFGLNSISDNKTLGHNFIRKLDPPKVFGYNVCAFHYQLQRLFLYATF